MDFNTELRRIEVNNFLDSMPANPWRFDIDLGKRAEESLRRLTDVMLKIANQSVDKWPTDEEWETTLPGWLLTAIPRLSKEDADKILADTPRDQWNSLPWDRLSWLDALRDRGWRWWGWGKRGENFSVVLHIAMYPERIDAFRELLRASEISIVGEEYMANATDDR